MILAQISRTAFRALSIAAPHSDRLSMGSQAFCFGQHCDYRRDPAADRRGTNLCTVMIFTKSADAQTTAKACRARRGQNVVRPGCVVADRLWRIVANKDRARAVHLRDGRSSSTVKCSGAIRLTHSIACSRDLPPVHRHCARSLAVAIALPFGRVAVRWPPPLLPAPTSS